LVVSAAATEQIGRSIDDRDQHHGATESAPQWSVCFESFDQILDRQHGQVFVPVHTSGDQQAGTGAVSTELAKS
jgi:hypothetical protein